MELDELKLAWQGLDLQLERQAALNLHLFREGRLDKVRRSLQPMIWGMRLQVLFGIAAIVFAAPIWVKYWYIAPLLISGIVIHLYGMSVVVFSGRLLWQIDRIEYAAPVLTIQQQLGAIRQWYLRANLWLGNVWWLLWMPCIALAIGWAGWPSLIDTQAAAAVLQHLSLPIGISTVVGVVGMIATLRFDTWLRSRPQTALALRFNYPRSVERAREFLEEIARFEKT